MKRALSSFVARQKMLADVTTLLIITVVTFLFFVWVRPTMRRASDDLTAIKEALLMLPTSVVHGDATLHAYLLTGIIISCLFVVLLLDCHDNTIVSFADRAVRDMEMQRKLRESQRVYQQLLHDTDRAIVTTDEKGMIESVNRSFTKIFGVALSFFLCFLLRSRPRF